MKVLFAAAELAPLVRVGGLAEAAGGLVKALRRGGIDVAVVLPDYGGVSLEGEIRRPLDVPAWAGPVGARTGTHAAVGELKLIAAQDLERSHPYADSSGVAWPDNDARFMRFSAAVAAVRDELKPDIVHLNDWHTAAAVAMGDSSAPTVLTVHTLGYQGITSASWARALTSDASAFDWYGQTNPMAGGIRLADRVIAVSPNYSREILEEASGMGLHELLQAKGSALVGILNGIDVEEWDPSNDPHVAAPYTAAAPEGREASRRALQEIAGWEDSKDAVIGVVSRLVDQKGIDLLLSAIPVLEDLPARLFVLGSGLPDLAGALSRAASAEPARVFFHNGYDVELAHRVFAGSDLFAMPSRFEPCGLAQMQAMAYGSLPVVTPVGGLVDTVIDADRSKHGNGFVARSVNAAGVIDAIHRGIRAYRNTRRRSAIQRRGMEHDWSWDGPAGRHVALYEDLLAR